MGRIVILGLWGSQLSTPVRVHLTVGRGITALRPLSHDAVTHIPSTITHPIIPFSQRTELNKPRGIIQALISAASTNTWTGPGRPIYKTKLSVNHEKRNSWQQSIPRHEFEVGSTFGSDEREASLHIIAQTFAIFELHREREISTNPKQDPRKLVVDPLSGFLRRIRSARCAKFDQHAAYPLPLFHRTPTVKWVSNASIDAHFHGIHRAPVNGFGQDAI